MTPKNIVKFRAYKSSLGVFISVDQYESWYSYYDFNCKKLVNSYSSKWKLLEGEEELTSLTKLVTKSGSVIGYTLIDPDFTSDKIPLNLTNEEVGQKRDEDGDYIWSNFWNIRSLYKEIYSEPEQLVENVEFEIEYLGFLDLELLSAPHSAKVSIVSRGGWNDVKSEVTISSLAEYEEIVKAVVPDIVIHNQPCTISSYAAFCIVRGFVKDNIDKKNARISSDYDFCFTVQKLVATKPVPWRNEITTARGKSYRPPRYKTGTTTHKEVEVFEMTHSKENYRGYTPIAPFKGDNLKELVENIQTYLEDLISYINTPFHECENCKGLGKIVGEKFKLNLREEK